MPCTRTRFSELDLLDAPQAIRQRPKPRRPRQKPWIIKATKQGVVVSITLYKGQNSFGSPDVFAGIRPARGKKEFAELRGCPLYTIQQWLVSHGYTYEVV